MLEGEKEIVIRWQVAKKFFAKHLFAPASRFLSNKAPNRPKIQDDKTTLTSTPITPGFECPIFRSTNTDTNEKSTKSSDSKQ